MILLSDGNFEFAKEGNLRYVDFSSQQPSPKTLRLEDYDKIMRSGCLFARKFNVNVDKEIVSEISKQICLWRKKD